MNLIALHKLIQFLSAVSVAPSGYAPEDVTFAFIICLLSMYQCTLDIRSPERMRKSVNYTEVPKRVVAIHEIFIIHCILIFCHAQPSICNYSLFYIILPPEALFTLKRK